VQSCASEKDLTVENLCRDSMSLEVSVKYRSTSALASLLSAQNDGSKCSIVLATTAIPGMKS